MADASSVNGPQANVVFSGSTTLASLLKELALTSLLITETTPMYQTCDTTGAGADLQLATRDVCHVGANGQRQPASLGDA